MPHNHRYRSILNAACLVFLFIVVCTTSYAQSDSIQNPKVEMDNAKASQVMAGDSLVIDTLKIDKEPWQPDPKKALWYSLAFPGLGQIYNHSWWKTPFIYGGLGFSIWFISENHQNYKDFRLAYSDSFDPDTDNDLVKKYPNQESLRRVRDIYYKRYQLSIIATAAIYLMNGLEAYVDAHLKNFEISDDLSLRYGTPLQKQGVYGSSSFAPNVIPVLGITYKLD